MPTPNLVITIHYPNGRHDNVFAMRAWVGSKRITWVNEGGVRSYVLLRHGFTVNIKNFSL